MKRAAAYTLGCKVNQYDTQAMCEILEKTGYEIVDFSCKADVYIINTCTVTNVADKKSRQIISRAARNNPDAVICVCGCLAQRKGEELLDIDGVSCVVGAENRENILSVIEKAIAEKQNAIGVLPEKFDSLYITKPGEKIRANVKIQEGCENFCSYCIIPYVRGKERSKELSDIAAEIKVLARNGVTEIVLTGIHVSSYNDSMGHDLADVVLETEKTDGIRRIRLGSLEQPAFTEDFIKKLAQSKKLCPHFHLSLQSGSNKILKDMNRKYTKDAFFETVCLLRRYFDNPAITTDIITGFPGETQDDFYESVEFAKKVGFAKVHVFPYSEREGTRAAVMKDVIPVNIRRDRANILIEECKTLEKEYSRQFLGTEQEVLFEQYKDGGLCYGHTTRYQLVCAEGKPGEYKNILLEKQNGDIIIGTENK